MKLLTLKVSALQFLFYALIACGNRTGVFTGTFRQEVNGSKNSVLNWVMILNLFMCPCVIKPFEAPQRNCGFGSHLLKKSLMENFIYCAVSDYLCSQKKCRKCIFQWSGGDLNFRKPHGDNELSNRQTVKKLNLWGKNGCR